ncbi:VOC family protein [Falsibacillus pallidus]|uniref:Catechol 2,3-dioxygenase n=1 Tax=Falsibacillus pallidus TaxID=493781 RepID=A0A370GPV2_9BACI|nr:VOC family protein [Falsibacillus pallidus]RDI45758.1 catechol 2,3-dioxygenase [Falsibacillus pallidus]
MKQSFHESPNIYPGEIELSVENIDQSTRFYQEIIGLKILQQTEKTAVLTADGQKPLVRLVQPEEIAKRNPSSAGLFHFALLIPDRKSLADVLRHFALAGYPLQGGSDHLVSEAIYLADPDGNGIEIYSDRHPDDWKWENGKVSMDTIQLNVNDLMAKWDGDEWTGLPEDTIMGHIHLQVSDLNQSEQFYTGLLGFDVVNRYGSQALFISTGKYHHHIGLNTWNSKGAGPQPENKTGLNWYSLIYPSEQERNAAAAKLAAAGYSIKENHHEVLVKDPSGITISLKY